MGRVREQKKQATREALRAAALRLALERGPDNVRVDDIAQAAGVSPRTYNNYFASREQAIVAAVTEDRATRIAAAITARPTDVSLADAVIDAVVAAYTDPAGGEALLMITTSPALRACYANTATEIEAPLADAIAHRHPATNQTTALVLAASTTAAAKIALRQWLRPPPPAGVPGVPPPAGVPGVPPPAGVPGLVVPAGALPDLIRAALLPLTPALNAIP